MSKKAKPDTKLYLTTQDIDGVAGSATYIRLLPADAKALGPAVTVPSRQALALAGPLSGRAVTPDAAAIALAIKSLTSDAAPNPPPTPSEISDA